MLVGGIELLKNFHSDVLFEEVFFLTPRLTRRRHFQPMKVVEKPRMSPLLLRLKSAVSSIPFQIASKLLFLRLFARELCYKQLRCLDQWDL